jgi:hypothetical protein
MEVKEEVCGPAVAGAPNAIVMNAAIVAKSPVAYNKRHVDKLTAPYQP